MLYWISFSINKTKQRGGKQTDRQRLYDYMTNHEFLQRKNSQPRFVALKVQESFINSRLRLETRPHHSHKAPLGKPRLQFEFREADWLRYLLLLHPLVGGGSVTMFNAL